MQVETEPQTDEMTPKQLKKIENAKRRVEYMKVYLADYRGDYYQKNRDKIIERNKLYNIEHADRVKEQKKAWWAKQKQLASKSITPNVSG